MIGHVVLVIVGFVMLVLTVRHRSRAEEVLSTMRELLRLAYADKTSPQLSPYREPSTVDTPPLVEQAPAPTVTDWIECDADGALVSCCPACARGIRWPPNGSTKAGPRVCLDDCGVGGPHFHLTCNKVEGQYCGFKWVMRAAMTKKVETTA